MSQGWNRPTGETTTAKPAAKSPSMMKGVIVGAVAVVVGVVCIFAFSGKSEKPVEKGDKERGRIKEVTPAAAPKAEEPVDPQEDAKRKRREMLKKMTPDQRADFLLAELKKKPIDLTPRTNQAFRTGTEQVMSWIFTSKLGDMPPPLPRLPVRDMLHMAEILIADNPELPTDSDKVKDAKQIVQEAKRELREYLKQGGEIEDFFSYYHNQLTQAHNEWRESNKAVIDACRNDPGIAQDFCKEVNKRLAEKGIKPVKLPVKLLEKQGIEVIEDDDASAQPQPTQP